MTGKCPPNISYQESDQTPVRGTDSVDLSMYLRSGLDNFPVHHHLSDWLKTICCGDYGKVLFQSPLPLLKCR